MDYTKIVKGLYVVMGVLSWIFMIFLAIGGYRIVVSFETNIILQYLYAAGAMAYLCVIYPYKILG